MRTIISERLYQTADEIGLIFDESDSKVRTQNEDWIRLTQSCDLIFRAMNKIDEIWPFIDSKKGLIGGHKEHRVTPDFTYQQLGFGYVDRTKVLLTTKTSFIFGGPGYGKTIFLQQVASDITQQSLNGNLEECAIPVFIKAKHLSEGIIRFCKTPWGISNTGEFFPTGTDIRPPVSDEYFHYGLGLSDDIDEVVSILSFAMKKTLPMLNDDVINNLFDHTFGVLSLVGRLVLIIDAYDECPKNKTPDRNSNNRIDLLYFFTDHFTQALIFRNVIVTCRNSHRKEITEYSSIFLESTMEFQSGTSIKVT